ncbi:MAG: lactonase family protein [Bryobacteraceae bacterium]
MDRITRRSILASSLTPMLLRSRPLSAQTTPSGYLLYVGTYTNKTSKGIYAFRFQSESGDLMPLGLVAETPNPTYLALSANHRFLYAVNEESNYQGTHSGLVSSFAIDHLTAKLKPLNSVASAGSGPCHLAVDHTGSDLFVANYGSGSAASFRLSPTGLIGAPVSQFQFSGHGPDAKRQEGPHAHCTTVSPDNRYVLVNDLGLDRIVVYRLDPATAKLTPNDPPYWSAKPGSGPRHLAFHPKEPFAYSVNEMASTVDVLGWDSQTGTLTSIQNISALPQDFHGESTAAEIVVDPTGRFVYSSNRGHNSIAMFAVDRARGTLTSLGFAATPGREPRNFTLDPTGRWVLVGNQMIGTISLFRRDLETGMLSPAGKTTSIDQAVSILFV